MVRAADTAPLDLVPEATALLDTSLELSRMFSDDLNSLGRGCCLMTFLSLVPRCQQRHATDP